MFLSVHDVKHMWGSAYINDDNESRRCSSSPSMRTIRNMLNILVSVKGSYELSKHTSNVFHTDDEHDDEKKERRNDECNEQMNALRGN